jgi:dephospho-CoA kinase
VPVLAPVVGEAWTRVWVSAPEETRVARSVARGMDERDARRRIASQPSDLEWADWADHVVVNDGTKLNLADAVDELVQALSRAR